jgi:hypothetical protein
MQRGKDFFAIFDVHHRVSPFAALFRRIPGNAPRSSRQNAAPAAFIVYSIRFAIHNGGFKNLSARV